MDDFIPQVGYRDLNFGMSPNDVEKILGPESESKNVWEGELAFEYDEDELPYVLGCVEKKYSGYGNFHDVLELTFHNDRMVEIHIQDAKKPINLGGVDLFS